MKKNTPFLFFKNYKTKNMENTKQFILTLIIVFLCALSCKSKTLNVTYLYKETANQQLVRSDTSLIISVNGAIIKIGDKIYIAEKRKCYYSSDDYLTFDEYKIDKTKITFNLDPDTGSILQVDYKFENKIIYYRK